LISLLEGSSDNVASEFFELEDRKMERQFRADIFFRKASYRTHIVAHSTEEKRSEHELDKRPPGSADGKWGYCFTSPISWHGA
jgi:hypothetical protein